jgi:DNA-directed RNA polymerase subunit RPC12/RpoP
MLASPTDAMDDLDTLLKSAAQAEWTRVVRRCAWCGRVAGRDGRYRTVSVVETDTVFTDGMCPPCGTRSLAQLRRRAPRRLKLAA